MKRGVIERYFDVSHLPVEQQAASSLLMMAYALGSVLVCLIAIVSVSLFGVENHEIKLITHVMASVLLAFAMHMTRKGYLLQITWVIAIWSLIMTIPRMYQTGGLNAMACIVLVPVVVFAIVSARRSIIVFGAMAYGVLTLTHCVLHLAHRPGWPEPSYTFGISLLCFTLLFAWVMLATMLVVRVDGDTIEAMHASTTRLEEARQEMLEQRIEAERAMQEARINREAKARYLANMSHELRTPLSTIMSYAELLEEGLEDFSDASPTDELHTDIEHIRDAGRGLLCRVNDILDLSRLEAGKMPLCKGEVALLDLLARAYDFATQRSTIENEHVARVRLRGLESLQDQWQDVKVMCDEVLVTKLLGHLWLHLEHEGPIFVAARFDATQRKVSVVCRLRSWTLPPTPNPTELLGAGELHSLLYDAFKRVVGVKIVEPGQHMTNGIWEIVLDRV